MNYKLDNPYIMLGESDNIGTMEKINDIENICV